MNPSPSIFSCTGTTQHYIVPVTGNYVIEASGAQGGAGGGPGGKGARVRGTFTLLKNEILQIVVGQQGSPGTSPHRSAGGGGGGTFVWKGSVPLPLPVKPLLAAGGGGGGTGRDGTITMDATNDNDVGGRCGYGGSTDFTDFHYSGGGGTGWRSGGAMGSAPTFCYGGLRWNGGEGADYCGNQGGHGGFGGGGGGAFLGQGSGGGGGYSGGGGGTQAGPGGGGGGSYNGGTHQCNTPGVQTGDGKVVITLVAITHSFRPLEKKPRHAQWLADKTELAGETTDTPAEPPKPSSSPTIEAKKEESPFYMMDTLGRHQLRLGGRLTRRHAE